MIRYFHGKGWEKALREGAVVHAREHAEGAGRRLRSPVSCAPPSAFVDLSGFTSLAEAMGDETAVRVLQRFSQLVREATSRSDGRIVKQIGDAFMLVFPGGALGGRLRARDRAPDRRRPQFPAVRTGHPLGDTYCTGKATTLGTDRERRSAPSGAGRAASSSS